MTRHPGRGGGGGGSGQVKRAAGQHHRSAPLQGTVEKVWLALSACVSHRPLAPGIPAPCWSYGLSGLDRSQSSGQSSETGLSPTVAPGELASVLPCGGEGPANSEDPGGAAPLRQTPCRLSGPCKAVPVERMA